MGVSLGSAQAIFIILFCPYVLCNVLLFCPNVCRAPCALDPDPPSLCWRCGWIRHCSPESSKGLRAVRDHHNPGISNRMWHLKARLARSKSLVPGRVKKCLQENKTVSPLEEPPIPSHPIPYPFFLRNTTKVCSITLIYTAPSHLRCSLWFMLLQGKRSWISWWQRETGCGKAGCTPHPLGLCMSLWFLWCMLCFPC